MDQRGGGLEMEAAGEIDGHHLVIVGFEEVAKLVDGGLIGAGGATNIEGAVDAENIAAVERRGGAQTQERTMRCQCGGDGGCFGPAGFGTGDGDDGDLVEGDRGVFDEDGVRQVGAAETWMTVRPRERRRFS